MKEDNFLAGKEAREKLIAGADKVADAVKSTLGAAGANFLSEHTLYPFYITSNDGVTLARAIKLADPYENLGAQIMQEIASKADKSSGDGTTTAITLAQAIIKEGKDTDIHPMQLKRELEECIPIVEEALKKQAKEIDVSEVGKVAAVSAEDETIGAMIQEIYEHIGTDGIIFNDVSRDFKDSYTLDKGVHIQDCGFASPYMADMTQEGQLTNLANIKKPVIVVTKQKINSVSDLESIGNILKYQGRKELVVFADEYEGSVVNDLVLTKLRGGIRTVLLKLPILWKDWWLEDIAKMTGATIVDPAVGISLKDFRHNMFGSCGEVICDKSNTFIDGVLDIADHVESIQSEGTDEGKLRAARLNKKTAKYHVGALSEQALKYRHDKVIDALGSAYQALHGGIVVGGGVALINCATCLSHTAGAKILAKSLSAPFLQIVKNSGAEEGILKMDDFIDNKGLNAKTGKIVDMFDAGIVDAYATTFNSFKAAVSVAATVLTAQTVTIIDKTPDTQLDPFRPYER